MKLSEYFKLHPGSWVKEIGTEGVCGCLVTGPAHFKEVNLTHPGHYFKNVRESIKKFFPGRGSGLLAFNDHPETTLAEVIAVLEDAGE